MVKKLFLFVFGLIASAAAVNTEAQETIRITTGEFPPYYSEHEPNYGESLHIVTQAFAQMNIKVEYGFFPWSRSYELVKQNDWDASCCWSRTPEREVYFNYSEVIRSSNIMFFHLRKFPFDWQSYEDLSGIRIGTTIRYFYGREFEAADKAGKLLVEHASSDEINFRKLLGGRIQIFPIGQKAGYHLLSKSFLPEKVDSVTHHAKALVRYQLRLMVAKTNKKSRYFIDKFNEGLKRLKASGEYEQYFAEIDETEHSAKR
ncbi:transporter substrate-binding domain-containing protein [Thalassomonas viridans]|uniref:Transporter substrate-binding domain-containing protein n=1 Tax=Thalassomonas viridans TaxID=137584 RepID=A0AAE9Z6U6_9GAMM|nr:transporter substrate-binding domain-containing protein [Thalassomonas viridans]WDE07683.1 transporter substrate-binding domain-containing protein [Thalassomonas viridans]